MKRPMIKFSVGIAALLLVLAGLHVCTIDTPVAWATVLEQVRSAETYSYRIRELETTGPRPDGFEFATEKATIVYYSSVYGMLHEKERNNIKPFARYYWLREPNEHVGICYPLEKYERRPLAPDWDRPRNDDPRQIVTCVLEGDYTPLGEDTYDGRPVQGVALHDPDVFRALLPKNVEDFAAQVWIDEAAELPVWVEIGFTPPGSQLRTTIIQDQFQWDIALDAALFEPEIPTDFTLDNHDEPRPPRPQGEPVDRFNANTVAEPYLGSIKARDLPDLDSLVLLGTDAGSPPATTTRYTTAQAIWEAQDACMAQWLPYEAVQERLYRELQEQLGIDALSVSELVATGIALRECFWAMHGCLSGTSYPYAYGARLVTALAYDKAPQDLDVIDHYVESLMTGSVVWTWPGDPHNPTENALYTGLLTELRQQQFLIIKQHAAQGKVPAWKDLVRVADLTGLLAFAFRFEEALDVTDWLAAQSDTAGWVAYVPVFERMQIRFADGKKRACPLFDDPHINYPEAYRYARRLWSFQGPLAHREQLEPRHFTDQAGK